MKILIDARFYGLENAGLGRYSINLIKNLKELDKKNQYFLLLRKKYYQQLDLPENWKQILADFQHYSLNEQIKLPSIISSINPDLVHFLHFNVPIFYKGRYIVTIHDLLMHKQYGLEATTLPLPLYLFKRLGYKFIFRQAVINSKKIIVPSNSVKEEVVKNYSIDPEKIIVTHEGIDEEISTENKNNGILKKYGINNLYFIYVGNTYPHKNLKRVIEAILLLNKEKEEKVNLIIVSSRNVFRDRIENLIKKLKAEEYIKLLDFIPDKELGFLYKNSLAFVFPSLSEGFGLPGLEAMAAGTIVLASEIPVFKEVYKDNALYFNPFDFSSIEKIMKDVLQMDQEKRKEIINNSQGFIKRYSWRKMAEEILHVYKSCVSLRSG